MRNLVSNSNDEYILIKRRMLFLLKSMIGLHTPNQLGWEQSQGMKSMQIVQLFSVEGNMAQTNQIKIFNCFTETTEY